MPRGEDESELKVPIEPVGKSCPCAAPSAWDAVRGGAKAREGCQHDGCRGGGELGEASRSRLERQSISSWMCSRW